MNGTDLRDRIDHANGLVSIYEFIEYVPDHSRPRKIHCPVHDDRTKSAQVYPATNSLYCFTEGRSYDPVGLVAEEQGITIPAACAYIERNAGVRWERQEKQSDEFWRLAERAMASPSDPRHWTRQETILYRWQVHRTVLELVPPDRVDWDGFDNAHLDVKALREWQREQLDRGLDSHRDI